MWVVTLKENLRFILGNILLIQLYFLKNNIYIYIYIKNLRERWVIFYDFLFL